MKKKKLSARERERRHGESLKTEAFSKLLGKKTVRPAERRDLVRQGVERLTQRSSLFDRPLIKFKVRPDQVRVSTQLQRQSGGDQTAAWMDVGTPVEGSSVTVPVGQGSTDDRYRVVVRSKGPDYVLQADDSDCTSHPPPAESEEEHALRVLGHVERDNLAMAMKLTQFRQR